MLGIYDINPRAMDIIEIISVINKGQEHHTIADITHNIYIMCMIALINPR